MYEHILFSKTNGIAKISLNRPEVYHALSAGLMLEIAAAINEVANDEHIRVLIITGEGEKAFCSGADLKQTLEGGESAEHMLKTYYEPMIRGIRELPKPVICRLNGLAVGAGCSLALACDIIIAREDAYLSLLFVQIGLMPDAGATYFLPRLIGMARTFELASTGRKIYAKEAEQIGLINKAVRPEELDTEINKLASYYQSAPTLAIGTMKKVLNESSHSDLARMQELERVNQQILFESSDSHEGISAFLEKRKPDFQGK
ncbi:enoyl-CoA hydratase/isomerase family protein [Dyadobacter aurulentus]|uniref:enoyl-CoA hydratase/isomerase family protein n=1 Tax=Dyadobacter sp. UC 10 TaxID=2605428 RepID=UPI0011F125D8|nr:enoyl-CoA hydratase-related protein [Dyadobacter sp. UC 10]KAA0990937.1 2-(1,2-epoxy-1,2-dihydrophenyl)acetyl-CoA isomerase [Dyadobacter sp. UC 10]